MNAFTDRELLLIQLRTLFEFDRHGRIRCANEPGGPEAPRIFAGRAGGERILRVRTDVPESVSRRWLSCDADDELAARVAAHAPIAREYRGPAFLLPPMSSTEDSVTIGPATMLHPELIARGWKPAETPPHVGVVRDGLVVAVCYSARLGDEAAEAGVETVEKYRGGGLAEAAVREWAAEIQSTGRLALYSTTWDNLASRRVAEKLGAREYGEDWHLT